VWATPSELLERVDQAAAAGTPFAEVILATNPNVEGEATALYLAKLLRDAPDYRAAFERFERDRRPRVERIVAAAKFVGAHDFIMNLDDGYETELHERGMNLSVGQRQLLSFARAIIARPRILILDEPTSMLTPQGVAELQRVMQRLKEGGIAIVFITHKLHEATEIGDRVSILRAGRRVWLVYTFPRYLVRGAPEIAAITERECRDARAFRGTVGGGDVYVCQLGPTP